MKTTRHIAIRALLLAAAGTLAGGSAAAQDIEMGAKAAGRTLPQGYYERIRRDPGFFEFGNAWTQWGKGEGDGRIAFSTVPDGAHELRMVVAMALFSDSPEPTFSTEVTHEQLFGANPLGNLTDFYLENSGGRVAVTGNVQPWVRTGITLAQAVGSSMGLGGDARIGDYMLSALGQMDAYTDFGQYDNNGPDGVPNSGDDDGFVDVTVFQYPEIAASCGGPGPWPHRSRVSGWTGGRPFFTNDRRPDGRPILVNDYIMQSTANCDGTPQSIATIAHETGHAFGLPDFYHAVDGVLPSQRRWLLGCWTLMAAGAWGCGDGASFGKVSKPSHMGPWEKQRLGWANVIMADSTGNGEYHLDPVQQSGQILRIPLLGGTEYLLVEYRPNTGFDSELVAGGILIYHVDGTRTLAPCRTCPRKYFVSLVEADGNDGLIRTAQEGGNRGEAGDVFQGSTILTDRTTPSLRLNSGAASNLALHVVQAGNAARVHVFRRATFPDDRVLGPMLGNGSLSAEEQGALDAFGNGNGRYDLGDLRAHLRGPDAPAPDPDTPQVP
jgi:M6 family metalloprotease-like protein